jgi:hypothetical protein
MPAATGHFQRAAEGKGGQAMWQKKICLMALTLAVGLGMTALVRADDGDDDKPPPPKGNWLTRIFVKDVPPKTSPKKMDMAPKVSPEAQRHRAKVEWIRRTEVCDKLQAIAQDTGDKDLARKAEALPAGYRPMSKSLKAAWVWMPASDRDPLNLPAEQRRLERAGRGRGGIEP